MAKHNGGGSTGSRRGGNGLLKIDVRSGDDLEEFCRDNQKLLVDDVDFIEQMKNALTARLERELKRRGMDHSGIFGSDARRTAKRITRHLSHVNAALLQAASALNVCWGDYNALFAEPIRQIEEAKEEFKV